MTESDARRALPAPGEPAARPAPPPPSPFATLTLTPGLNKTFQTNRLFKYPTHFSVRTRACFPFTQQWPHPALANAPSLIPGVYFTWERESHPQAPPEPGRGVPAGPPLTSAASPDPLERDETGQTRKTGNAPCQERADFSAGSPRRQARDYSSLKPVNTPSPAPSPLPPCPGEGWKRYRKPASARGSAALERDRHPRGAIPVGREAPTSPAAANYHL